MGFRFRQSFKLFPGARLNIGKSGFSVSFGMPGATINVGRNGIRSTVGLPGTGLSYTSTPFKLSAFKNHDNSNTSANNESKFDTDDIPFYVPPSWQEMKDIRSSSVENLTSEGLKSLREMIIKANEQKVEIDKNLAIARDEETLKKNMLVKKRKSLFRLFYKRKIAQLDVELAELEKEITLLEEWREMTRIEMTFDNGDYCKSVYDELVNAFNDLAECSRIWDVTSHRNVNQILERSVATRAIEITPVIFNFVRNDLIQFQGKAMRMENANGADILIYPGIVLMQRADGVFALIDLRDLDITAESIQMIETNSIPQDARVVAKTWAKTNKDGSPDKRFKSNYEIPICLYGELSISSKTGICERYKFSRPEPAHKFMAAFAKYKKALQDTMDKAKQ